MPIRTIVAAAAMRTLNGSFSRMVPRATAMIGFTYAYSETVATGRCLSVVRVRREAADRAEHNQINEGCGRSPGEGDAVPFADHAAGGEQR